MGKGEGGGVDSFVGKSINVFFDPKDFTTQANVSFSDTHADDAAIKISHEGSHVHDAKHFLNTGQNTSRFDTELKAFKVESVMAEVVGYKDYPVYTANGDSALNIYKVSWTEADKKNFSVVRKEREEAIKTFLKIPESQGGLYGLTSASDGGPAWKR